MAGFFASAVRAAFVISGALAALSGSQLGELTESLVNAQFSQSQESDADDFSYELLKKRGVNTQGLVTAFEKLAKLGFDPVGSTPEEFGSWIAAEIPRWTKVIRAANITAD